MNDQSHQKVVMTPNGMWTVVDYLAIHSSGLIATAKIRTTDQGDQVIDKFFCMPKDWAKNHGLEIQVICKELDDLALKGVITHNYEFNECIAYELPEGNGRQYQEGEIAYGAIYESELKAITFLRDELSVKDHEDLAQVTPDSDDSERPELTEKLEKLIMNLEVYGDVRPGVIKFGYFCDFNTPRMLLHPNQGVHAFEFN